MITRSTIDRILYLLEQAQVVEKIVVGIKRDKRGRKTNVEMIHLFLVGLSLAVHDNKSATIQSLYETLTQEVTIDDQIRLGVRNPHAGPDGKQQIALTDMHNVAKLLNDKLEYGPITAPDLDPFERERRAQVVASIIDAVCDVFMEGFRSTTYAIDATGVWAWPKSQKKPDLETDQPEPDSDATPDPATDARPRKKTDAGWGTKTSKSGKEEKFFGYYEHAMVVVPHGKNDPQETPPLIARFSVENPSADLAEVTLALIDRAPGEVTSVIIDRHYSYKRSETWRDELARRGIAQVLDLRIDEQGWSDLDGVRFAAGVPHCPSAPDRLGRINPPSLDASQQEREEFRERIQQREAYSLKLNRVMNLVTGKAQYICPARYGTVACSLIPGSMQAADVIVTETGQPVPIVQNPPDPNDPICPPICTQPTMVIDPGTLRKHIQPEYWGSEKWAYEYRKRTYVEGAFGNLKNQDTENQTRGYHRAGGIGRSSIYGLASVLSYNLRMLRNWHERTGLGDPDNPLLSPEDVVFGYMPVTEEDYMRVLRAS